MLWIKIVVLDFGSQYSHLICRRIRDFSVYAELVPFDISLENLKKLNPKGIIFSGGPSSVYDSGAPIPDKEIFQLNVPILGICYGHQIIVNNFGGKIKRATKSMVHLYSRLLIIRIFLMGLEILLEHG